MPQSIFKIEEPTEDLADFAQLGTTEAREPNSRPAQERAAGRTEFNGRTVTSVEARSIYLLLREMQDENRTHHAVAATRDHVEEQSDRMVQALQRECEELRAAMGTLQKHIDAFSVRNILTAVSLFFVGIATVLMAIKMLSGPFLIGSPFCELFLITSVLTLIMSRTLPVRTH